MQEAADLAPLLAARLAPGTLELLRQAGDTARRQSAAVYLVGGVVRDLLQGKAGSDLDLVVEGDGPALAQELAAQVGARLVHHHRFGTASLLLPGGGRLDVATARRERYAHPGALPQVEPADLRADLLRRDFTVNAMAIALRPESFGRLHDPCGGQDDLHSGLLRVMHPASFVDDPTRVLRAVRLEEQHCFRMEPLTLARALQPEARRALTLVSGPRVWHELERLFGLPGAPGALRRLEGLGLTAVLWPWLARTPAEQAQRLAEWLARPDLPAGRPQTYLALLLYPLTGEMAAQAAQSYGLARRKAEVVRQAVRAGEAIQEPAAGPLALHRSLAGLATEAVLAALAWRGGAGAAPVLDYLVRRTALRPLPGAGRMLQEFGVPPGPLYKDLLRELEGARLQGLVRTRAEARQFLHDRAKEEASHALS